ncbi:hypothetical protein ACMD2_15174 [Ananas comosus]|uniref:Uncharacterized protein n=1 Tax=Ananas comosus TaxID=4615 RepID=A0A199VI95_ANACO|nr:hypothetical protein ACMD2_15174 [Ananas comosus]
MAKPLSLGPLGAPNFQSVLKESIDRFLVEIQKRDSCDFSPFRLIFFRLLQSSSDPPLEIVWFYSAVGYHEAIAGKRDDPLGRVAAVKDLLQMLAACSASCGGAKCLALLAPAVSELYYCALAAAKLPKKEAKRVNKEMECLVEGILSYISICSSKSSGGGDSTPSCLLPGFGDLVRVWTVHHANNKGSGFGVLFPLVSDETRYEFSKEGCGIGYLAAVVVAEAFLLRLCLKVQGGGSPRPELQKELRIWTVSSITVFQNRVFFEILLRLLLEPHTPLASLLSTEEEILVRDILYDALILVDYSFVNPGVEVEQADESTISILITRLIVAYEATEIARRKGDQGRALSYINAFSTSSTPIYLTKWVGSQVGSEKLNRPNSTAPQALLKWLVDFEDKGLRLLGDNISRLRKRLMFEESKVVSEHAMVDSISKETDADLFFFDKQRNDTEEDHKDRDIEMVDNAFMAAANSMKSAIDGRRKRKGSGGEGELQVKFVKYKIHDSSVKDYFLPITNGVCSGSEVENSPSDAEMEETD